MAPRIITTKVGDTFDLATMTRYTTDEEFSGIWGRSADTTLVFTRPWTPRSRSTTDQEPGRR